MARIVGSMDVLQMRVPIPTTVGLTQSHNEGGLFSDPPFDPLLRGALTAFLRYRYLKRTAPPNLGLQRQLKAKAPAERGHLHPLRRRLNTWLALTWMVTHPAVMGAAAIRTLGLIPLHLLHRRHRRHPPDAEVVEEVEVMAAQMDQTIRVTLMIPIMALMQ